MKTLLMLLLGFAALRPTKGQSAYEVTPSDRNFTSDVFSAVGRKDAAWIAAHTLLPIAVTLNGERRIVMKKEEFSATVTRAFTDNLCARIQSAGRKEPFKNWRGVMIGGGILWIAQIRRAQGPAWEYVILAIGDFAFQPEEPNQSL